MGLKLPTDYYALVAGITGYVRKDSDILYPLTAPSFVSFEDIAHFLRINYRNELPAGFAGGPASAVAVTETFLPSEVILTANEAIIKKSDSYNAVPPNNESFKNTLIVFWDNTGAATTPGKMMGSCNYDDFGGFCMGTPVPFA